MTEPVLTAPGGLGGTQYVYRFPNGWGASVIRHGPRTELAVTRPVDEHPDHFYLVEDDPLTADERGSWLTDDQVEQLLDVIAARPHPGPPDMSQRWEPDRRPRDDHGR